MHRSTTSFIRCESAGVVWYSFAERSGDVGATAAISTRHGGVSEGGSASLNLSYAAEPDGARVRENRRRFFTALALDTAPIVVAHLAHGTRVAYADESNAGDDPAVPLGDADALITDRPGVGLFLCVADCVPVLAIDPIRGRVGLAHAGWRGTLGGIATELIRALTERLGSDPADLQVGIGPAIGSCCYEVGPEICQAFQSRWADAATIFRSPNGHWRLDLGETNRRQLIAAGVPAAQITGSGICTSCQVQDFFSHRAQRGTAGRFGAIVALPEDWRESGGDSDPGDARPGRAARARPRTHRPSR